MKFKINSLKMCNLSNPKENEHNIGQFNNLKILIIPFQAYAHTSLVETKLTFKDFKLNLNCLTNVS